MPPPEDHRAARLRPRVLDTLRLARHLKLGPKNGLAALVGQLDLRPQVDRLAAGSQPHRALWDTLAAALLLPRLVSLAWPDGATLADLAAIASVPADGVPHLMSDDHAPRDAAVASPAGTLF